MSSSIVCRPLETTKEKESARAVVLRTYAAQGYGTATDSIARFLDTPEAKTFGLFRDDLLYGTISVVPDTKQGLPMDSIYREELRPLREKGLVAEVVQFAVDHDAYHTAFGKKPLPFDAAPLFAAVLSYALDTRVEYLCIAINPKHDRFYNLLGFKQIGGLKHYGSVDAPAIARAFLVPEWEKQTLSAHLLRRSLRIGQ